ENTPVTVEVTQPEDKKIKISVKNEGPGIPEEILPKIFDRFFRAESSRNRSTGGAGLGLSVVKSIVTWHQGEIRVKSIPDKETEFSIILPNS
ncbi:MAG TPA: ATP-binding protein, partial [Ignavibacteriales bacterium]|nr:ATP-binding protein [Ignavibacteriales bacterium]